MDPLVSTDWLAGELDSPDLRILDATWFLPGAGRDAAAEHAAAHIPGAVFMDLNAFADDEHPVPGMVPPDYKFASRAQALGVGDGDRIVVYDNSPQHTSARAWWMFRVYGASDVAILDGGLAKWKAEGRPVESGTAEVRRGHFSAKLDRATLAAKEYVAGLVHSDLHEIVDARGATRFAGETAEPRPGVAPGHIPGAKNLPHERLFNEDGSWKRGEALRAAFEQAGVDLAKPMVTTCGSGVTAAVLLFGAHLLGKEDVKLYDGSWAEWGADPSTPKATGST